MYFSSARRGVLRPGGTRMRALLGAGVLSLTLTATGQALAVAAPAAGEPPAAPQAASSWPTPASVAGLANDRLVVGFRDGAASTALAGADLQRTYGVSVLRDLGDGTVLVTAEQPESAMRRLAADPAVAFVESDQVSSAAVRRVGGGRESAPDGVSTQAWSSGEGSPEQWWRWEDHAGINVPGADQSMRASIQGAEATVAVVATGRTPHPVLYSTSILPGYDFASAANNGDGNGWDSDPADTGGCGGGVASWAGTAMQGVLNGRTGRSDGFRGIGELTNVLPVRAGNDCGFYDTDIATAIRWAAGSPVQSVPLNSNPADVIVLAPVGLGQCPTVLQNAINVATLSGSIVVAGTTPGVTQARNGYPANCTNVFGVAPTDRDGDLAYYGSVDTEAHAVDSFAPGGTLLPDVEDGIWTTTNAGTTTPAPSSNVYDYYEGPALAATQVAGAMALLIDAAKWENDVVTSPTWLESNIEANDRPVPGSCSIPCAEGLLDVRAATNDVVNYFVDTVDRPLQACCLLPPRNLPGETTIELAVSDIEQVTSPKILVAASHPERGKLQIYVHNTNGVFKYLKDYDPTDTAADVKLTVSLADVVQTPAQANGTWYVTFRNRATQGGAMFRLLEMDF